MPMYLVIPGKKEAVEFVEYERLPSGNFWVVLRCGVHQYGRVVTAKGLAAIRREVIEVAA